MAVGWFGKGEVAGLAVGGQLAYPRDRWVTDALFQLGQLPTGIAASPYRSPKDRREGKKSANREPL
jgi:hypothetical protein